MDNWPHVLLLGAAACGIAMLVAEILGRPRLAWGLLLACGCALVAAALVSLTLMQH